MNNKQLLLHRLDAIGRAIKASSHGLALIGLGSVGTELHRLDEYSDLDFFVLVEPGTKGEYLDDLDWLIGEILTNVYVGLCRYRRGERLSAARCVQQFAVDRLIELLETRETAPTSDRDPFSNERRIEERCPELADVLPHVVQGYDRTPESAKALVEFLAAEHDLNRAMLSAIREMY